MTGRRGYPPSRRRWARRRNAVYTAMRLFVATGQERARRFYAREGWADVGAPFFDPRPGLELQEMRRPVG